MNYLIGKKINNSNDDKKSKTFLIIGIILNLACLGVFKYANFIIENINYLSPIFKFSLIKNPGIVLPIGISFYTFQAISYIIDVYRGEVKVQNKFTDLALYISFFPQLIAGPIIRYKTIELQLKNRKSNWLNLEIGIKRFTLGLFKKVIIANQFGAIADVAFKMSGAELNSSNAWIGIIAYTVQIYFDFSGYSDMAIGLGRMLGFHFPENFNFPYIAKSIREFWQRWHITLSDWFRSYLYFPIGGNRKGSSRTIINLLFVFFATSIWHGASWNFVIWGITHGFFMVIERVGFAKILTHLWTPFQHIYTLLIIMFTWVFFKADGFNHGVEYISSLCNFNFGEVNFSFIQKMNSPMFICIFLIAIASCTKLPLKTVNLVNRIIVKYSNHSVLKNSIQISYSFLELVFIVSTLFFSTLFLIANSYNPFIYFRF
ncbi:MAG: MBOAT family protein [Bacteroidales bacterium]